jgi:outer membrane biogenesis lipoprotein LolB
MAAASDANQRKGCNKAEWQSNPNHVDIRLKERLDKQNFKFSPRRQGCLSAKPRIRRAGSPGNIRLTPVG